MEYGSTVWSDSVLRFFLYLIVPEGVPHRVISDDIYNGYYIPAGAMVIPNVWQVPFIS